MDFSSAYFGKPLSDLQYEDIVKYFVEHKQESETIEFKSFSNGESFEHGLQNVIRGISAFLNSSGGILIWGAPKGVKLHGQAEKIFVGGLAPVTEYKEKDSLINKITSVITPMPIGINVNTLKSENGYIYVAEIQQSIYKPHQFDHRYYVRLDGQTKPAPHYLVDALIKQISYPNLQGVIKFHPMTTQPGGALTLPITVAIYNFSELQNDEAVSFRVLVYGGYFLKGRQPQFTTQKAQYNMNGHQLIYEKFANVLHFGTPHIHEDRITISKESLSGNKGLVNIVLSFGGKKSPAKVSSYTLNLKEMVRLSNPNEFLIEVEESMMFSQLKQSSNYTSIEVLKMFVER
jgi:hypothetical protein